MNMVTVPIKFRNIDAMDAWYHDFEKKAIEICRKYGDVTIWDHVKIYRNTAECELAIASMGTYDSGSKKEKALEEILNLFNSGF